MQRLASACSCDRNGDRRKRGHRKPAVADTDRIASAPGLTTLAPACTQALPSLASISIAYTHEAHAELVYDLCAALVREGLGTPELWSACEESPMAFAHQAMLQGIGDERRSLLNRNVEYHLQIRDVAEQGGSETPLAEGRLMATVECGGAGFLPLGAVVEALELEAEGLGAAFYWIFTKTLYRVIRLYNHEDALQYEECLRESAEEDEGNPDSYEFPEVEKALPKSVRESLALNVAERTSHSNALIRRHRQGRFRTWFDRLRRMERLARLPVRHSPELFEGEYDSGPLPCLIVVFQEHDAIQACFDEESQSMLECSAEPTLGVEFAPRDPNEVRRALRVVGRFLAFNTELFAWIEELQAWEVQHAGTGRDRGELLFQAA